jgi:hypothetical protein
MKEKAKSYFQRFMEMTDEQRDAEVARFDQPFVALRESKPLTRAQRAVLRRAKRKAGDPTDPNN